jgi:hypothetical protein
VSAANVPGQPAGNRAKIARNTAGTAVFLLILFLVWFFVGRQSAGAARPGDCVSPTGNGNEVGVVDCGSSEARYKVVERLGDDDKRTCEGMPGVDAVYTQTLNDNSFRLCLAKV